MFKKILGIGSLVLVGLLVIGTVAVLAAPGRGQGGGPQGDGRGPGGANVPQGDGCGPGSTDAPQGTRRGPGGTDAPRIDPNGDGTYGELSEAEIEALQTALEDEYKAWSVYEQVIADFGAVRPFTSIQKAEENHISALENLFTRYGLEVPENEWLGNVPSFDTLAEACAAGVQAEIDNGALYDELFDGVDNEDLIQVFTALQTASETRHLPAFERCAP